MKPLCRRALNRAMGGLTSHTGPFVRPPHDPLAGFHANLRFSS